MPKYWVRGSGQGLTKFPDQDHRLSVQPSTHTCGCWVERSYAWVMRGPGRPLDDEQSVQHSKSLVVGNLGPQQLSRGPMLSAE